MGCTFAKTIAPCVSKSVTPSNSAFGGTIRDGRRIFGKDSRDKRRLTILDDVKNTKAALLTHIIGKDTAFYHCAGPPFSISMLLLPLLHSNFQKSRQDSCLCSFTSRGGLVVIEYQMTGDKASGEPGQKLQ